MKTEMGARPDIKLSVKLKDGDQRHYPLAAWTKDRGQGLSGKLDEGWKLVGPDGVEYTSGKEGNAWIDIYDNREDSGAKQTEYNPQKAAANFGDDDVPF